MDTEPGQWQADTLMAVEAYPRLLKWLKGQRAELLAAAWQAGNNNVAELQRAVGVKARGTVYEDLKSRGMDLKNRGLAVESGPRHTPFTGDTANLLAWLMYIALPSAGDRDTLRDLVVKLREAMIQISCLLDLEKSPGAETESAKADKVQKLTASLNEALDYARAYHAIVPDEAITGLAEWPDDVDDYALEFDPLDMDTSSKSEPTDPADVKSV